MIGRDWIGRVSRHFRDGEYWHPPHRLRSLGQPDEDVKARRSEELVSPAGVPRWVEQGSRRGRQVRLPEQCEESKGEAHPQGRTQGPQAGSEVAELMKKWGKDGQMLQGWRSHGDVGRSEQTGHLVGLQGRWSVAYLLVEGPNYGDIIANATCRQKPVGEVTDVQAHSGDVWIKEVKVVVIAELYEQLGLQGVVSGGTRAERVQCEVVHSLMKLRQWQVLWNEITHHQTM